MTNGIIIFIQRVRSIKYVCLSVFKIVVKIKPIT